MILRAGFEGLLWDFKPAPPFSARKPLLFAARFRSKSRTGGNLTHGTFASIQPIHRQGSSQPRSCSLIDLLQLQERIFVSQSVTRKRLKKSQEFPSPICCNPTGGWCCASDTARTLTAVRECFHAESSLFEKTRFFHPVRPELV